MKLKKLVSPIINRFISHREFMFKYIPKNGIYAEIGVWKGNLSSKFIKKLKPKKIYLIDPYIYIDSYEGALYGTLAEKGQQSLDTIYQSVCTKFSYQITEGQVEIIRKSSEEASSMLINSTLDMVYIDGDHTFDGVKKDLENYFPKLKQNGIIICDDYGIEGWWKNGVTKAVDEFVQKNLAHLKVIEVKNQQYVMQKTSH